MGVEKFEELEEGVFSIGPFSSSEMKKHVMVLMLNDLIILIVGCSHPGIDTIASAVFERPGKIYMLDYRRISRISLLKLWTGPQR
ncbi:MAG: hypothetical protein ACP5GN_07095 [Fervidicoccaceae archaeon]